MPNLILESHAYGYILRTAKVFKCGIDRSNSEWEPASHLSMLYQSDWEFPGLASLLGFAPCECGRTDGTIDCEHKTASEMICEASDFLDNRVGDTFNSKKYPTAYETVMSSAEWG